ncbi:phosphate-starvation-inducible PsiE family protein [Lysobacter changpingensis]|uniref:phosphate-starvation-inducible PsiE family protein n=1 Tax=Lysobacter changpingensis TaxID=2792784 RepID=UPI001A8CB025|nr:phosphate-starvation-inducible PsiE family protein [Lysobacter changpingensis]
MNDLWPRERFTRVFEKIALSGVQMLLMALIVLGLLELIYLLVRGIQAHLMAIGSVGQLHAAMQQGFAGILLILIGLELIETVRAYLHGHRVRLEIVMVVAVIAVARHIVDIDLKSANGVTLLGVAALILALTTGYFLVRHRARTDRTTGAATAPGPDREEID